ncbi:MAG: filamentous hemagglutinin N-terminal domain-containing protein [Planctomycetota bacterium]
MTKHPRLVLLAALPLALATTAGAAPDAPHVVSGAATFDRAGRTTTITTTTPRTILEYGRFDIGRRESVVFDQPGASSAVLNRIVGGTPTSIRGQLTSNGQVYLVNPAGVVFGRSAVVDVGRLVAAAAHLDDHDFLAGIDRFTDARGRVVNASAELFGRDGVVLVGRNVTNHPGAAVRSDNGQIVLAVGDDVLVTDGPDGRLMVKLTGFGGPRPDSRLRNRGTIDAGVEGAVVLGAGDLLGLSVLRRGRVEAADITLDTGHAPLNLSRNQSRFATLSDTAAITINTAELHYFADAAPNDRLALHAPGGFSDRSNSGLGPLLVNGEPFPPGSGDPGNGDPGNGDPGNGDPGSGDPGSGDPGSGDPGNGDPGNGDPGNGDPGSGDPGNGDPGSGDPGSGDPGSGDPGSGDPGSGDPGSGDPGSGDAGMGGPGNGNVDPGGVGTFVDAYARFAPVEPLTVAPAAVVQVDARQAAALRRDFGVDVKSFEERPLLEALLAATVFDDSVSGVGIGDTNRVSAGRLGYVEARDAIEAYGRVFEVNTPGDAPSAADQTQRVRMRLQAAADRYMADAETTELEPAAFLAWLEDQDRDALEALAGLDELVNDAMPSLGLSATELDRFRRWTYGKIAPQGVSLRTLEEIVAAAGRS